MTSEQIIKANKLCAMPTSILCEECPYHHLRDTDSDCVEVMTNDTIDFIEGLINGQISLQKALAEKIEESENQSQNFKVLISDHRTLHQSFDNLKGLYEAEKAKVEKAKEKCIGFAKELQTAKAELKETTEKFNCQQIVYADLSDIIRGKNAEIERLKKLLAESEARENEAAKRFYKEGVTDFAERLKNVYTSDKRYDRPNPQTMLSKLFYNITIVAKELRGDSE